jgi:hypothetical protein
MNQGIAFARTLRALDTDDFRASKLGLLVAAALLIPWAWWMFGAHLPQYESTTTVRIESGRAIAFFPPDALSRIHADQPAILQFDGKGFPARVRTIGPGGVELVFTSHQPPVTALTSAIAEVEVSRISPAALALRILR